MKAREQLGMDVELTNEQLPADRALQEQLLKIAKLNRPEGMVEKAVIMTAVYLPESSLLNKEAQVLHSTVGVHSVNEKLISFAVSDLARHLMNLFGRRRPASRDEKDKRSDFV